MCLRLRGTAPVLRWWTSDMWRVLRDRCNWSRTKRNKTQSPPTKWQQRVWKHHRDTRLTASRLIFPIPTEQQEAIGTNHRVNNSKGSWPTSSSLCNMCKPTKAVACRVPAGPLAPLFELLPNRSSQMSGRRTRNLSKTLPQHLQVNLCRWHCHV